MNAEEREILHEHLGYEIDMVAGAVEAIAAGHPDWFQRMSAIETFWLHARNLLEFFEDRTAPGRIAAAGLFTEGKIIYQVPSREKYEDLMNNQIAHLSYGRPCGDDLEKLRAHDVHLVAAAIARAVSHFEQHLRPEAREICRAK